MTRNEQLIFFVVLVYIAFKARRIALELTAIRRLLAERIAPRSW